MDEKHFLYNIIYIISFNSKIMNRERINRIEQKRGGFKCVHCGGWVTISELMGTHHRNHCPFCLWSKHVDLEKPGDRKASCGAGMEPVGLTFKREGYDKYGRLRQGELMVIHHCTNEDCGKISINRIAGDDSPEAILRVFERSLTIDDALRKKIAEADITLLTEKDEEEIRTQLFGKSNLKDRKEVR